MSSSNQVSIYEVGLRDGLQNEATIISTDDKLLLANALVRAGLTRIEATSFVSPKWIPQLADADALFEQLPNDSNVSFSALCPNPKGFARARALNVGEIAIFVSASETHNRKNVNRSIAESLAGFSEFVGAALDAGMRVRGYVSTVWGCPYQGEIALTQVSSITQKLLELGCYEVSLGDTIGIGNPTQTRTIMRALLHEFSANQLAMHMHDTRGLALVNILVGLEEGLRTFDSSIGGLGGCPYAPGAAGNVASEDLVNMLHSMGMQTGVDLGALWQAGQIAAQKLGRTLPSKMHQAGLFTLRAP